MSSAASSRIVLGGLALAAGAYFALASPLGIEYIDEGQIVYPSWAVSQGAIPYREFRHLYGPALFFLNGGMLRWLGEDLLSIRLSLVLVKALLGVTVYLLARRIAAPRFAFLAWIWFVAVWGSPLVFNTPYANHYALTLGLLGLLVFLSIRARYSLACAAAGFCFGAAAMFKQTSGLFELMAFLLFLIVRPTGEPTARPRAWLPGWLARLIVLAVPALALALFTVYLWPRNTALNFMFVLTPPAALAVMALVRASRAQDGARQSAAIGVVCAGLGAAVPALAFIGFYGAHGLVGELVFHMVSGLPSVMRWFIPYSIPQGRTLLALAALAAWFAALLPGRRQPTALVLALLGALAAALFLGDAGAARGLSTYFFRRGFYGDALRLWFALPIVAVACSAALLFSRRLAPTSTEAALCAPTQRHEALLLLACHAAVNFLYLYPAGDVWHVLMILPSFLPLIALLVEQSAGAAMGVRGGVRLVSTSIVVATIAVLTLPSVQLLLDSRRGTAVRLQRATWVTGAQPQFGDVARLVGDLERRLPPDRPMLVTTGEQMIYFLAGRRSALERDEFVLYLVAVDLISEKDARELVDASQVLDRLGTVRPLIVDRPQSPMANRFRRVFSTVADYIDAHYSVAATFGSYRLLEWKS